MKKKIFTVLFILPAILSVMTGTRAYSANQASTYGHVSDEGFSSVQAYGAQGDLIIAGKIQNDVYDRDIWLTCVDSDGDILWGKTYGGEGFEAAEKVLPSSASGIILAGTVPAAGTAGYHDLWLMKLSSVGGIQWQKTLGTGQWHSADMAAVGLGTYILAGSIDLAEGYAQEDLWVMKFDENGTVLWQKSYGTEGGDENATAIQQARDGGYIVSGNTTSFDSPNYDFWLLKLDADGNVEWEKAYGSTWVDSSRRVLQTSDGGYIVVGGSSSFGISELYTNPWVLKLDSGGNIQWQKAYITTPQNNSLSSVFQAPDKTYIVAGPGLLMRLSGNGDVIWSKTYECSIDDIMVTETDNCEIEITTAGSSETYGLGQGDGCVLHLDSYGECSDCSLARGLDVSVVNTGVTPRETAAEVNTATISSTDTSAEAADFLSIRRDICAPEPTVRLPKTGQTTSYATGDDGDLETGVEWPEPRFTDNGDGTITDNLTGLTWLKDSDCLGKRAVDDFALNYPAAEGVEGLNTSPASYECTDYTGEYTDWRIPSITELYSLANVGVADGGQWLMDQGFVDVQYATTYDWYWTKNEHANNSSMGWVIHFNYSLNGVVTVQTKGKDYEYWVWPVRGMDDGLADSRYPANVWAPTSDGGGVVWPATRFTDNGDGTVTDNMTDLMWLKDVECFGNPLWEDTFGLVAGLNASSGCEEYTDDYTDWRVPNLTELLSLVDYGNYDPAMPVGQPFGIYQHNLYSSNTVAGWHDDSMVHSVSFRFGLLYFTGKASSNYNLLPVRDLTLKVTFTAGENGGITGDLDQDISRGGDCTPVTAVPNSGYFFLGWEGGDYSTESTLTITDVTFRMSFTARFGNDRNADTDGDGMPDGWELDYGLKPLLDDAYNDKDCDGYSNLKEYQKGTDPTDPASYPVNKAMPWLMLLLSS